HGEIVVRFETRRVPRMGEDREETEVPRRRAGEGTDEPAPRHPGEHGAERLRRDRRPDHAARQADVTRSDNPTIGRKSLQPGPAYRGPWPRKKSETHGSVRRTGPPLRKESRHSHHRTVEVDVCPTCNGIFL